jgi:hypothetical protein
MQQVIVSTVCAAPLHLCRSAGLHLRQMERGGASGAVVVGRSFYSTREEFADTGDELCRKVISSTS